MCSSWQNIMEPSHFWHMCKETTNDPVFIEKGSRSTRVALFRSLRVSGMTEQCCLDEMAPMAPTGWEPPRMKLWKSMQTIQNTRTKHIKSINEWDCAFIL